ncbi:MFS general substrate transporter, partial [Aureobasidium melanogenum]
MNDSWDCHVHCFDPAKFPFKQTRSYTPCSAPLDTLVNNVQSRNLIITQATIEDGFDGIQEALKRARACPELRIVRGTIMANHTQMLDVHETQKLHELGVRCVRIHGAYGGAGNNLAWITEQLRLAATSIGVKQYGWYISAQLPLQTWASLGHCISELKDVTIIVDHSASAQPSDLGHPAFAEFLQLLGAQNMVVKIGALHRRSKGNIQAMRPIVDAFIATAPDKVIFGSDWPHVDASRGGQTPTPHLQGVDITEELRMMRTWMSEEQKESVVAEMIEDTGKPEKIMDIYRSYEPEYAAQAEHRLVKKIDRRILPLIVIIYLFNYLDRNSITQARLYGLQKDTKVNGAVYQTSISIFSAGYIFMQLPSTILMTKLRPSIFLPCCIILWAIVSGCTAAANSPGSLLAIRFCLGLVEAPFFPGAIYFLSCWYTKKELGIRMALLICGLLLSNAFAGLISAGILKGMAGVGHLHAWRWLFILEGLATVCVGCIALFVLPDYPATTRWLTEEEKIIAQGRLAADAGSDDVLEEDKVSIWRGIAWAGKDYRVWLFAGLQMATTASISYSHFFPTLIQRIGIKDRTTVLLLTSPPYLVAFFWALSLAWIADKRQIRSIPSGVSCIISMMGTILLVALPHLYWARYAFTFLVCVGTFGIYSTTYTWLSSTIPRPPIKRAAAIGIANTLANLASLYANYFWLDEYEPTFQVSWGILLTFQALALACILTLRFTLQRKNKKFEKLQAEVNLNHEAEVQALDEDAQRAVKNNFRYVV